MEGPGSESYQSQSTLDSRLEPFQQVWACIFILVVGFLHCVLVLVRLQHANRTTSVVPLLIMVRYAFPPLVCGRLCPFPEEYRMF